MIRINLLPHREEARKRRRQQFYAMAGAAVGLAALVVFLGYTIINGLISSQADANDFLKREIAVLDKQIAEIKLLKEKTQALLARKQVIEDLQRDRGETVYLLTELVKQVPEGVYLKSLKQEGQKVNITGYAQSNARVSALMRNLEASPWLENAQLIEVKATVLNGRRSNEFAMNFMLTRTQAIADEFRGLNPNDPGSWPQLPKIAALLGILLVLTVAGWWFLWSDQLAELEVKQKEEETLKQQYLEKKRQAVNLDLYIEQLAEIDRSFGALLKQLPNKSEVEALLIEVNQAGLGRGLQFDLFRPGAEQVKDFYAELPIAAFAADIAKLPRIVTLNNIAIAPVKDNALTLDATTKTFRYLDEEEVAKQKKAAQGANK